MTRSTSPTTAHSPSRTTRSQTFLDTGQPSAAKANDNRTAVMEDFRTLALALIPAHAKSSVALDTHPWRRNIND
jgi:hypothetical protein